MQRMSVWMRHICVMYMCHMRHVCQCASMRPTSCVIWHIHHVLCNAYIMYEKIEKRKKEKTWHIHHVLCNAYIMCYVTLTYTLYLTHVPISVWAPVTLAKRGLELLVFLCPCVVKEHVFSKGTCSIERGLELLVFLCTWMCVYASVLRDCVRDWETIIKEAYYNSPRGLLQ